VGQVKLTPGVQAASDALPGGRRERLQLHDQAAVGALRNTPPARQNSNISSTTQAVGIFTAAQVKR
jgi:hypothetical protein